MATTTTNALSLASSSALVDAIATPRQAATVSPRCVSLPTLPPSPVQFQHRVYRTPSYCRKITRNVVAMASGEAPVAAAASAPTSAAAAPAPTSAAAAPAPTSAAAAATTVSEPAETSAAVDTSEILKTIQDTWDKVEDKYAVSSLAAAGVVALWGSAGMISAIDRLPLLPGVFEIVGIGYTGWFAYQNIVFKPDREALIVKIKDTYKEIID